MGLAVSSPASKGNEQSLSEDSTGDVDLEGIDTSVVPQSESEAETVAWQRPQIRSKAQSWGLLPESHRGITVQELWDFYDPESSWLEAQRWRCGICHKSCCCEKCVEPEPTQEAETRTQEEGEDEGGSDDNFAEEVVEQIGAVFAGIERKVAEEKRAWRMCFNRFKPETHGRCSHCGAEGGPGRWEERNLYEVVEHMVKPICAQLRVSYVELLRRGPEGEEMEGVKPDTFVSHWWGEEFPKFVRTLTCFAEARSRRLPWTVCTTPHRNPKTWAFWICAFANNQYAIEHALGDFSSDVTPRTAVMTSAFATALDAVSDVVAVLDDRAIIYTRIWCCFELFSVARLIPDRKGKELEIFIADESGVVSSGCGNVGMMNALIDKVKTAEAEASNPDDKAMIESAMLADGTTSEELDGVLQMLASNGRAAAHHRRCMEFCALVVVLDVAVTNTIGTVLSIMNSKLHYEELLGFSPKVLCLGLSHGLLTFLAVVFLFRAEILACRLQRSHRLVQVNHRLAMVCMLFSVKIFCLMGFAAIAGDWAGVCVSIYLIGLIVLTLAGRHPLRRFLDPVFV
mmetsp:Transcript_69552/g.165892  ORF Transcript_69552/g.165892 Transcript_69552/m.165892 type:complete len:569 (-) Transcript_69552:152-1858(-)